MRLQKTSLIIGAVAATGLLLATVADAEYISMKKTIAKATSLSATAINSAAYTGWVQVQESRSVVMEVTYTNSAATAVTMTCETSDSASTANGAGFELHELLNSGTAGTSDSYSHTWSNAVAGDESWTWTVANLPHNYINCAFLGTGADGSDVVTVKTKTVSP